jgi:hypothetical protein
MLEIGRGHQAGLIEGQNRLQSRGALVSRACSCTNLFVVFFGDARLGDNAFQLFDHRRRHRHLSAKEPKQAKGLSGRNASPAMGTCRHTVEKPRTAKLYISSAKLYIRRTLNVPPLLGAHLFANGL